MSSPLHIVLVIDSLKAGGAERVLSTMASYWTGADLQVSIITFREKEEPFYALGPEVLVLPLGIDTPSGNWIRGILNSRHRIKVLKSRLERLEPDVVIGFFADINVLTLVAARRLNLPVIISERNHPRHQTIPLQWKWARRLFYRLADRLVVQTCGAAVWYKRYGVETSVIPNPLKDMDVDGTIRENWILAVGRLTRQKGFDLLLKAFQRSGLSPYWQLVIAGEGEERKRLEELAVELGIADSLHFAGLVKDIDRYYARASVFVLSSRYEGFPNALAEAMAAELPCISFACDYGPSHMISHRWNGMLVDPVNVEALGRDLRYMADHPQLRAQWGARAREDVNRLYNQQRIMTRWEDLIKEVLKGSSNGETRQDDQ